ncbi:PAS domain-containing sensor histidine kinase [bacterium]|nr:PAS domain-containing sensor histidine kinase [bacterium]
MENALRERERFIQQVAATAPDVIYIYDLRTRSNVYANRPFGHMMGYDAEAIAAFGSGFIAQVMHPDDLARFSQHFAALQAAPADTVLEFDYRMKSSQGEWLWFNSRDTVFDRDSNGQMTHILGVARDITTRKNAERALEESEERFRQIAETVSSAFWIVSADARETFYVSPAYEMIWRRSVMEMYANPHAFLESVLPDDRPQVTKALETMRVTGKAALEYRIVWADGAVRWVASRSHPVIGRQGQIERIITVSEDITERKTLEQHTFMMAVEHERIRLLADFVHDTSHDLRTPLTIISTGLYLLRRITDPQKQAERIDLLEKQVQNLNRIIGDLHAMSDLDLTTELQKTALDMNQIVRDLALHYDKITQNKRQTFVLTLQPNLPVIEADFERIKHALMNLVDNAILYTESGGTITVTTRQTPTHVMIAVADTGMGIGAEHLDRIFDRFYKVNFARTSGQGGPGLGLSIVKKIVEMHQGTITVESTLEEGSVFCIALPLRGGSA